MLFPKCLFASESLTNAYDLKNFLIYICLFPTQPSEFVSSISPPPTLQQIFLYNQPRVFKRAIQDSSQAKAGLPTRMAPRPVPAHPCWIFISTWCPCNAPGKLPTVLARLPSYMLRHRGSVSHSQLTNHCTWANLSLTDGCWSHR